MTAPLAPGSHSFAVRALDEDAVDLTPVSRTFTVATPDTRVDGFFAKAKGKQKQKGKKIRLEVKLGAGEDISAVATAEVKLEGSKKKRPMTSGSKDIASQEGTLKLKPKRKSDERKIVKALKRGDKVKAKVTVTVTDAAGNEASKKLDVKLKRG